MTTLDPSERELAVAEAAAHWARFFGAASVAELRLRYEELLRSLDQESAAELARATATARRRVEREHSERYGVRALTAELVEERERDAAALSDPALVAYEAKWRRKLRALQQAYPQRWRVPGLSEEEVRDSLTLRLIEVIKVAPDELSRYGRAGKEWGLACSEQHLGALRKNFGLSATPADFNEAPLLEHAVSHEERWLALEADRGRALARERAELGLSRPQRRWLAALKSSANAGAFFDSSERPNLSAASRLLGKNRSSAQRAYRELRERFVKELNRLA